MPACMAVDLIGSKLVAVMEWLCTGCADRSPLAPARCPVPCALCAVGPFGVFGASAPAGTRSAPAYRTAGPRLSACKAGDGDERCLR